MQRIPLILLTLGMTYGQVDYGTEIQTMLDNNCTSCHGYSGGLNLTNYDDLMSGGDSGDAIVPGDHANSLLWQRVESGEMPGGGNEDLTSDEIDLIATWIDEGALETPQVDVTGLFFSEYAEGSSNNKYFEIYNGTGETVSLDDFVILGNYNGNPWSETFTFDTGATIDVGDVYVIASSDADATITDLADETHAYADPWYITAFNGNDVRALAQIDGTDTTIIDMIGTLEGGDPGAGWDVAGVTDATANHTLLRQSNVMEGNGGDWNASAGTSADNSEWIVLDQDTWDYLGSHPHELTDDISIQIVSPEDGATLFSDQVTIEFFVANFTIGSTGDGVDGHVHYMLDDNNAVMHYSTDPISLEDISVGDHVFHIWLVDSEHGALYPFVGDTLNFSISETGTITSIYDIQYVTDPDSDDASPLNGEEVTIQGVVTAEFWGSDQYRYMHVQDDDGPWNGIVCFEYDGWHDFDWVDASGNSHPGPGEGDEVTLTGTVEEYYNLTELAGVTSGIVHGESEEELTPSFISISEIGEAYEGCLIAVEDVVVTNPDLGYGEWEFGDGELTARCDDKWNYFYYPVEGHQLADIEGVLDYNYDNYKLQPRLARDVVEEDLTRIQRIQQVLYSDLLNTSDDGESDISYMLEDTVTIEGIVTMPTGLSYAGAGIKFIFQDENGGPWSSILSYDPDSSAFPVLYEGDRIQATGYVYEYTTGDANMTELFITAPINILEVGVDVPEVEVVETGDLRWPTTAEQWGNVTVKVEEGIVTNNDLQYEIFEVDDGSGGVLVDDDSDSIQVYFDAVGPPPVGTFVSSITGWVYHHYGSYSDSTTYKLEPLYVSDIDFGAGPPIFSDVSRDPCAPGNDEDVVVSAVITDNSVVSSAEIMYSVDGGAYQSVTMVEGTDDTWTGTIPHVSPGGSPLYYYYISATDDGTDQDEPKTSTYPYDIENDQLGYWGIDVLYIENIQYTDWPSGNSLYDDCEVTVTGIVTADTAQYNSGYGAYAIQDNNDVWDGIIFDGWDDTELTRGDAVTITGTVAEFDPEWHFKYDNNTKIIDVSSVTVTGEGSVENLVLLVSTEDLAQDADEVESYEGCLVTVSGVTVSAVNAYDWSIIDDSGVECLIDDDMANMATNSAMSALTEGETLANVSGIFNFSYGTYKIQIRDMADLGQLGIDDDFAGVAREFALYPNYPNPFNPETRIRFQLAENSNVRLMIYDVLGRKVRTLVSERMDAGHHVLNWNGLNDAGADVASGMYVYRIKAGDFIAHRKMLLVR